MRFYLDNDVDVACRAVLQDHGHDVWSTSDAGRGDSDDPSQHLYAYRRKAAIITHDREFTARAKEHIVGQHIRMCVEHPFAPEVLARHLNVLVPILEHHDDLVAELHQDSVLFTFPNGGQQRKA